MRPLNDDGEMLTDDQLWVMSSSTNLDERADGLLELGLRAARAQRFSAAVDFLTSSIDVFEQTGANVRRGEVLYTLACALLDDARPGDALDASIAASEVMRTHAGEGAVANAVKMSGFALFALDQLDEAAIAMQSALRLYESAEQVTDVADTTEALADIATRQGDYDSAVRWRFAVLTARQQLNDPVLAGVATTALGAALLAADRVGEAVRYLQDAIDHWRYLGHPVLTAESLGILGAALRARGDFVDALVTLTEASALLKAHDRVTCAADIDVALAQTLRDLGRGAEASALEKQVQAFMRVLGHGSAVEPESGAHAQTERAAEFDAENTSKAPDRPLQLDFDVDPTEEPDPTVADFLPSESETRP